jgi:hypothetical protein
MNLSELRTAARNLLNEETPGFWTNAQLDSYLSLAAIRVNSVISNVRQDYFTISATFNTAVSTKSYALPSDCKFIRRMELYDTADANNLTKIDEIRFPRIEANGDWLFTQNGQPRRYSIRGTQFDLYPIPDSVYPIRLYYDKTQLPLATDSDVPTAPTDYHDMIVYWACLLAKKQNEDDDAGFGALFNIRKEELVESLINRGGEDSNVVEAYLQGII